MNICGRVVIRLSRQFNTVGRRVLFSSTKMGSRANEPIQAERGIIDMRSDVLTKPSKAIIEAMFNSTADDDVYREDRTVLELEVQMAKLFGKDAALFVPSGTMGNLIGVLCHCQTRGLEVILGDKSHMFMWEQGGISQIGGLHSRAIPNKPDGTFDLDVVEESIRPKDDPHQPWTGLIIVENTHNYCGGKVIPLEFLAKLREKANKYGIPVHVDGARILNAAVALKVPVKEIMAYADSVSFCFSKGVGAPIGSILVGSHDLIARALRLRKVLGGGWRKPGCLAAAAMVGMEDAEKRLLQDHEHAKMFSREISANSHGVVRINAEDVHTNIMMVEILRKDISAEDFCKRLEQVTEAEYAELKEAIQVKVTTSRVPKSVRVCTYSGITTEDVRMAIKKWLYVLKEMAV